jgi:hypothetical protein
VFEGHDLELAGDAVLLAAIEYEAGGRESDRGASDGIGQPVRIALQTPICRTSGEAIAQSSPDPTIRIIA